MKFDDKPLERKKVDQHITPQSAMDAYFDDMFGTVADDPLKKLAAQTNKETSKEPNKTTSSEKIARLEPKLQPKEKSLQLNVPAFDEPDVQVGVISPLIIPAAFPRLAPVETKAKIEEKPKIIINPVTKDIDKVQEKVAKPKEKQVEVLAKPKLDAKTALAILEKQKSKLSMSQRQRLEQKLNSLVSKTSAKPKNETKVSVPEKKVTFPEVKIEQKAPSHSPKILQQTLSTPVMSEQLVAQTEKFIEPVAQKSIRPDWANSRFECLIFSVAGLKLAVPLLSLGAIYKIEKEFVPLVGRASWFMGLYHHLERNVRVIDTAEWVMPERCSPEVRASYKFIIRLGGNDWGMACDAVHESIQLSPEQVKWRTERTKRAWLFGTVIDHMCALIDADSLSNLLNQQVSKNPRIFS